ncbi:MAG: O-antigen ligase domain-containing protein, partial [Cardiobacterium sp.]
MKVWLPRFVNGATFLFFALSLALKSGYSYGAALLLVAALTTLPVWWRARPHDPALRWLAGG